MAYVGAGIGIAHMNRIMNLILFRPLIVSDLAIQMNMGQKGLRGYLRKLLEAEKIMIYPSPSDGRERLVQLIPGALPFDPVMPVHGQRKSRATGKKRGPKPGIKRPVYTEAETRKVRTIPAAQIGARRDELVAALFGAPA